MAYEFFRGYVPTKDKKCMMGFKGVPDNELLTLEEAEKLDEYAGILSETTILVDVDDEVQSEILLNIVEEEELLCRVYKTTRGMHFLFKNVEQTLNKIHANLACGLTADIKLGCKNSYSVLKFNGKTREIIYDILDGEEYEVCPKWLYPIKHRQGFLGMENSDGRNQALFSYILTLQSAGFSVDECKKCISIINRWIFKDPLDDSEIDTILRDDSFTKPVFFDNNGKFLFDKFAAYLKTTHHIIKLNGELHIYSNGVYIKGQDVIERAMIEHIPNLNRTKRQEVLSMINLLCGKEKQSIDARYIAFNNCIYDVETDEILDFTPDIITTNRIPHDYVEGAYDELTDRTLNKLACGDKEIRALLEEVIGYTFYRRNELRKAFILVGDKANGKSSYLDMIETLLGADNTTSLDLSDVGDRFKTAEIAGKLADIGDDLSDNFVADASIFKKLVSGDRVTAERKGQDPFDFNNYAKLLFSANNIPRIKDKSGAVLNRLIIIPFNASFSRDDPDFDPYIKYKLRKEEAMRYLIQIGLDGLARVLDNQGFTEGVSVQKEWKTYEEYNNPVLMFFNDGVKIENELVNDVYTKYVKFCTNNGFTPMSKIEFSRQICKSLGLVSKQRKVAGEVIRIYVKEGGEESV